MEDMDLDESSGWLALADTEWKFGYYLSEHVKEKALSIIARGADLNMWEKQKQKDKRKSVLDKLALQLERPLPKRRRLHPLPVFHCPWKVGDIIEVPFLNTSVDVKRTRVFLHLVKINTCKPSKYAPDDLYSEYPCFLVCDCDDKERVQSAFDYRYLCRPVCAVNAEILGYKQLIELDMDPINRKNSFDFPVICHINPPDLTVLEPIDYDGANAVSLQDDLLYWLEKSETRQL